mmetsp:Transcript_18430/g.39918  ORF Transcript_18430/g.39918 Transcript_18430/m.39918 type:complete len:217 (+) Transcript_18430:319-969(+)
MAIPLIPIRAAPPPPLLAVAVVRSTNGTAGIGSTEDSRSSRGQQGTIMQVLVATGAALTAATLSRCLLHIPKLCRANRRITPPFPVISAPIPIPVPIPVHGRRCSIIRRRRRPPPTATTTAIQLTAAATDRLERTPTLPTGWPPRPLAIFTLATPAAAPAAPAPAPAAALRDIPTLPGVMTDIRQYRGRWRHCPALASPARRGGEFRGTMPTLPPD